MYVNHCRSENLLVRYKIKCAAYHDGDFNGMCCWYIVEIADEIISDIRKIVTEKKINSCSAEGVIAKMASLRKLFGLLDAVYGYVNIIEPNTEEKQKLLEAVTSLMASWRENALRLTLKAHLMEHHVCNWNDEHGIGGKDESHIEKGHQEGAKDDQ